MRPLAWPVLLLLSVLSLGPAGAQAEPPAIQLLDFAGHPIQFAAVQRDATVLSFWSAACVPCIEEMPLLDALNKKLGRDGQVAVLGINLDEDEDLPAARKVLAEHKVSYPMLRDPQRALVRQWFPEHPEQLGLPMVMVLDRQLHARYSLGFAPGTTAAAFIAEWSPRLAEARAGKLTEHLQRIAPAKPAPSDPAQMAQVIEKIVRSHHPELAEAEVKKRVAAALAEFRTKGTFAID